MTFLHVFWHAVSTLGGICFLGAVVLYFWGSTKLFTFLMRQTSAAAQNVMVAVMTVYATVGYLIMYLCLTGHFLYELIIFQVVVVAGTAVLLAIYEGIFRLNSEDDNTKLFVTVNTTGGNGAGLAVVGLSALLTLGIIGSWYFALAHYTYFADEIDKRASTLLFVVVLPSLMGALLSVLSPILLMLRADVDNDVRSRLAVRLIMIGVNTSAIVIWAALLYPDYFATHFGHYFGPASAGYVIGGMAGLSVVVCVIGILAHASEAKRFKEIEDRFVVELKEARAITDPKYRAREISDVLNRIEGEIGRSLSNDFMEYYLLYLIVTELDTDEDRRRALLIFGIPEGVLATCDVNQDPTGGLYARYCAILRLCGERLHEWNIRAGHIRRLFRLYSAIEYDIAPLNRVIERDLGARRIDYRKVVGTVVLGVLGNLLTPTVLNGLQMLGNSINKLF